MPGSAPRSLAAPGALAAAAVLLVASPWREGALDPLWAGALVGLSGVLLLALAAAPGRLLTPLGPGERWVGLGLAGLLLIVCAQVAPLGPALDGLASPGDHAPTAPVPPEADASTPTLSLYPHATRVGLLALGAAASLALLAARGLGGLAGAQVLVAALVATATAQAGWGLLQLGSTDRVHGTYVSPNHFAGLLALALPFALARATVGRPDRGWLWLLPAAVLAAGIVVSGSRSGALAAAAGVLTATAVLATGPAPVARGRVVAAGGAAVGVAAVVGVSALVLRFEQALAGGERLRVEFWRVGVDVWREAPWLGVGLRCFGQVSPARAPIDGQLNAVHNDYLNLLVDVGALGGAAAALALAGFVRAVRHGARTLPGGRRRALLAGGAGAVAGVLVSSVVEMNLRVPANLWAFAAAAGLAVGAGRLVGRRRLVAAPGLRAAARVALTLAGLALVAGGARHAGAELLAATQGPGRAAALARAARLSPEDAAHVAALAREHEAAGDLDAAVAAWARACARAPRDPHLRMGLGRALLLGEHDARAEEELGLAEALAPFFSGSRLQVARLRLWADGLRGVDPGRRAAALAGVRAAVTQSPWLHGQALDVLTSARLRVDELARAVPEHALDLRLRVADWLARDGRPADAARLIAPVAAGSPDALLALMRFELACRRADAAAAAARRAALAARPPRGALVEEGCAHLRQAGFADAALALAWDLAGEHPDDPSLQRALGGALLAAGAPLDAARALERAFAAGDAPAGRALVRALDALGDDPGAERALRALIERSRGTPDEVRDRLALATRLTGRGRVDDALEHLERAAFLAPHDPAVRRALDQALGVGR